MGNSTGFVAICSVILAGCGPTRPVDSPPLLGAPPEDHKPAERRPEKLHPLDQRVSFTFMGVALPDVISRVSRETKVPIGVSTTIPVEEWARHRVSLRMQDVTLRALLDWLVRPLRAEYAVEATGGAWLCRRDDLLDEDPFELRTYRVPTHVVSRKPLRGLLDYEQEQKMVLNTLHACLRYLEDRRLGCRLAFHEGQDVLVARLPGRGHERLVALLDAMRHGSKPSGLPRPLAMDLRAKLQASFAWSAPPGAASQALARIAEAANVNLGWDTAGVGDALVFIPAGTHTLKAMLDAIVRQTPLRRYEVEPGHGIWLCLEAQDAGFPSSGATLWDRAFVRAYDVRPVLERLSPEALMEHLRKNVDPGQWNRGLPAAAAFLPTHRLIVVHDEPGHRHVASVVRELLERYGKPPAATP
jgi:hypothetical protein